MDRSTALPDEAEVVCVGETMVAFTATEEAGCFAAVVAGAESNVAVALARIGHRVRWVSRLGDDPIGTTIADVVARSGVEVDVVVDPDRPSGIIVRHRTGTAPVTSYHRRGSAASALVPDDAIRVGSPAWVHLSGITPALSSSAAELVETLVTGTDSRISFDVNLRPALWPDGPTASARLGDLARRADLVFLGDDEAEALFGTSEPSRLATELGIRGDRELVVKQGAAGASAVVGGDVVFVPALEATVVDVTGAGDAFAAGYLAGTLRSWPVEDRLRLGHRVASRVVAVGEDQLPPLTEEDRLAFTPAALRTRWASA